MKYLVVDDSKMAKKMVVKVLSSFLEEGDEIFEANNGLEGVNLYKDKKPDLVFMDLTMPIMDGFSATMEINRFDENAKVIAISADIQQKAVDRVMQRGALSFVQKPINEEKMRVILEEYVGVGIDG
jgi:CheY-like chemotaxis protein